MFPVLITDLLLTQRLSFRKVNLEEAKKNTSGLGMLPVPSATES